MPPIHQICTENWHWILSIKLIKYPRTETNRWRWCASECKRHGIVRRGDSDTNVYFPLHNCTTINTSSASHNLSSNITNWETCFFALQLQVTPPNVISAQHLKPCRPQIPDSRHIHKIYHGRAKTVEGCRHRIPRRQYTCHQIR